MKFMHIADVHLGAKPDAGKAYTEIRGSEIWNSFQDALNVCEQEAVDILLIAGDLFHRQPLLRELKEADYMFSQLTRTKVVLIAGNHDYIKKDSYYRTFQWCEQVYPLFEEELACVEFPELELSVYGLSYHSKEIRAGLYDQAYAGKRQKYEILLAHGGDEKHIPIKTKELLKLGYDYIALGHIHKPEILVESKIAYAGSLEPLDKNETGSHGYLIGELGGKKNFVQFIDSAKRAYVHLDIAVDQETTGRSLKETLVQTIEQHGRQHMYRIRLNGYHDPEVLFDLRDMDVYGNILDITDETRPAYDFEKLMHKNKENLLGKYIAGFIGSEEGSVEHQALYEGVQALLEAKRG